MIKNSNDVENPKDDFIRGSSLGEFDYEDSEEGCDVYEAVMSAIFLSRPLGILWDEDLIEEFLKTKGYKIIERTDENGEVYTVPVKNGSKIIPDQKNSLRRVFDREIQKTLINWLSKLS